MKSSVNPIWDARGMNEKTKQSRVSLTINMNGYRFWVSINVKCTKAEFNAAMNTRSNAVKDLRTTINDYISKADAILKRLPEPNKDMFLKFFKSDVGIVSSDTTQLFPIYLIRYNELVVEKRFGTAHTLKAMFHSLLRYKLSLKKIVVDDSKRLDDVAPTVDLSFEEINTQFLKAFKVNMVDNGRSDTTAGIYLGHLRAFYNYAIEQGFIPEKVGKAHPFYKIKISNAVRSKSVLYVDDIKRLWEYDCQGIREERAVAYWFACYLMNGMNFKDLCYLRWKNVKGDLITFIREKTKRTSNTQKEISVYLHDEVKKIIERYGNKSRNADDFIFPMLNDCKDLKHMEQTKNRLKKVFNNKLSAIGKKLGLNVHLCLSLARHSFATSLKVNGTPTSFISDCLGHTSISTTEHYMKSLPNEKLQQISNTLLPFNTAV